MTDKPLILNRNVGQDVLHRSPTQEKCNVDQAVDRKIIDAKTAAALIASGEARTCQHCIGPEGHL